MRLDARLLQSNPCAVEGVGAKHGLGAALDGTLHEGVRVLASCSRLSCMHVLMRGPMHRDDVTACSQWHWVDLPALAAYLKTKAILVEAVDEMTPEDGTCTVTLCSCCSTRAGALVM